VKLFGTDGVRAPFGEPPLDRATVTPLAAHLGGLLAERTPRPSVVLGGDTRDSTPEIWAWLGAGLRAAGAEVRCAGVVPTPAVGWLARNLGAAAGVSVSASHNPHPDNGIKLLDAQGGKWREEDEAELERRLAAEPGLAAEARSERPASDRLLGATYVADLAAAAEPDALAGLKMVIDAANGAAWEWAPELFRRLGAEVTVIGAQPDGRNINLECGSTQPRAMAARVAAVGADLGLAFDGDADRVVLADERGAVRDGDAILYLWARDLHRRGELGSPAIVATTMSNLGLERALAAEGIAVERCDVGDRAVVETLRRRGLRLGGEQSGHVVDLARFPTGDGLRTALAVALLRARAAAPLSNLLAGLRRYPQLLRNVRVLRKEDLAKLPRVVEAQRQVDSRLGADGRLVLRYSGTEPLARIMIEGPDQATIEELADLLENAIRQDLGLAAAPAR
jgi:phosphoglucosamine mutase